jgi:glycine/D-amino acid oxidase-like deaminating enzyme
VIADVAVVGGGIVGCATAAFLAAAGARVTLYERAEVGAGASGRNSGIVQHPFDPVLVGLYRRSLGLYRDLEAELPDLREACGYPAALPAELLKFLKASSLLDPQSVGNFWAVMQQAFVEFSNNIKPGGLLIIKFGVTLALKFL